MRTIPLLCSLLCSLSIAGPMARGDEARPPNILLAIADDWGLHAGAYGSKWVSTPAFDRLAREGLLFRHAYTPTAKCAPSRAVLLTGRYPWALEAAGNHMAFFPAKFTSWPEALAASGWFVGMTGKGWGPGVADDSKGAARLLTGRPFGKRTAKAPTRRIANNDYAANFADFLDAAPASRPWCFWYGALEPHRGYQFRSGETKGGKRLSDIDRVPSYWPDEETVRRDMLDYAFEVEHFDLHLGRMLAELERRGQLENTLVVATSDHGMPFPRVKGYAYHDGSHVPLAVRWPAGVPNAGRVIDDFVDFADIAPTVLDLAGIAPAASGMAPMMGASWRPIFASEQGGQVVAARDHVLLGKERTDVGRPGDVGYPIRGLLTADFLYLRNYEPDRWPAGDPETGYLDTDGGPTKSLILQRGRRDRDDPFWRLNFGERPAEELYDLTADPDCVHNLAGQPEHSERKGQMHERLTARLKEQGDPRMFGHGDVFDSYPVSNPAIRNFYERFMKGEGVRAGWVEESDFEEEIKPGVEETKEKEERGAAND